MFGHATYPTLFNAAPGVPELSHPTPTIIQDPTQQQRDMDVSRRHMKRAPAVKSLDGPQRDAFMRGLMKDVSSAPNELEFRKTVALKMSSADFDAELRRSVMADALTMYRERSRASRPASKLRKAVARGGDYHRRIPKPGGGYTYVYDEADYVSRKDAHLDGETVRAQYLKSHVGKLLDDHAEDGAHLEVFRPLVKKHGAKAIAGALKSHGAQFDGQRIRRDSASKSVQLKPGQPTSTGYTPPKTGTGHENESQLPPGSRRVWHKRVVEKYPDGSWHVVGHIAGLEDRSKQHPPLDPQKHVSPAELKKLAERIRQHQAHEAKKT